MKKLMTILQLIIGVIVILFALILFWQAFIIIVPRATDIISFKLPFRLSGLNEWMQLILALFIFQVVAVYTKKLFDSLSVKG
jgi:hypothetical protein